MESNACEISRHFSRRHGDIRSTELYLQTNSPLSSCASGCTNQHNMRHFIFTSKGFSPMPSSVIKSQVCGPYVKMAKTLSWWLPVKSLFFFNSNNLLKILNRWEGKTKSLKTEMFLKFQMRAHLDKLMNSGCLIAMKRSSTEAADLQSVKEWKASYSQLPSGVDKNCLWALRNHLSKTQFSLKMKLFEIYHPLFGGD